MYPKTWYQVALERGAKENEDGSMNGGELERVGVSIINGCAGGCQATVAPYNSYKISEENDYAYCKDCAGVE